MSEKVEVVAITDWGEFLEYGKLFFSENVNKQGDSSKVSKDDFVFKKEIGQGFSGQVVLTKHKATNAYLATKILKKSRVVQTKYVQHALGEKRILQSIICPFTIKLHFFFQDNSYLFYVLPYVEGGDLFYHLQKAKNFTEARSKFYASQVLLAIEYLHYLDYVYRDLKPENILLDQYGYIKVGDFGFCKMVPYRTYTLCGTPDYMSPEMIQNKGYGKSIDFWAFGVLIYEMTAGYPPFQSNNASNVYSNILKGKLKFPRAFTNDLKELLRGLIQANVSKRLGSLRKGIDDIKNHKWFKTISWHNIINKRMTAPFIPEVELPSTSTDEGSEDVILETLETDKYKKYFEHF